MRPVTKAYDKHGPRNPQYCFLRHFRYRWFSNSARWFHDLTEVILSSLLPHRLRPIKLRMNPILSRTAPAAVQRHNARLGLQLFFVYLVLYVGFVLLNAFSPDTMEWRPWGGVNLALLYGFGLIVAALGLAFVYGLLARVSQPEETREVSR